MKPEQQKNLLYILVPSSILVVLWIVFSVYNKSVTTTISKTQTQAIQPISPFFPTGVLSSLKSRQTVQPLFDVASIPNTGSTSGKVTLTPTPTQEEDTIQASDSGDIEIP